jgi:hypothetical protein
VDVNRFDPIGRIEEEPIWAFSMNCRHLPSLSPHPSLDAPSPRTGSGQVSGHPGGEVGKFAPEVHQ